MTSSPTSPSTPYLRPGSRAGAKSNLSAMIAKTLVRSFRSGSTMQAAARAAGINVRTLGRWFARGHTEDTGPYRALLLACQQACAAYDRKLTREVGIADLDELVGAVSPKGG